MIQNLLTTVFLVVILNIIEINCHGWLRKPIARSSAWKIDNRFPAYYSDNQMFCGGFDTQWSKNGKNLELLSLIH